MYNNQILNGNNAYTVTDMFNDLHPGIFSPGNPDAFKRNIQRFYVERLKKLLTNDFKSDPEASTLKLASAGITPIQVSTSDIRPMVRAELKKIANTLPKAGDAITQAHYADLRYRITQALAAPITVSNN